MRQDLCGWERRECRGRGGPLGKEALRRGIQAEPWRERHSQLRRGRGRAPGTKGTGCGGKKPLDKKSLGLVAPRHTAPWEASTTDKTTVSFLRPFPASVGDTGL